MFKVSKLTDYATIVLIHLGQHNKTISSSALAVCTSIPEPTVAKILKMLTRASLIKSFRGAGSGYFLERSLSDITLLEVIESIEGPVKLVDCHNDTCRIDGGDCSLYDKWDVVNNRIMKVFDKITIADLKDKKLVETN